MAAAIELNGIEKRYGAHAALDGVSLSIAQGQFVALVGASGSGKTTLLKTINGLVVPDGGQVRVAGEGAMAPHLLRRRIGYVFQEVGLFPHLTVAENIVVTPRLLGWDKARMAARVDALLDLVDLPRAVAGRAPAALSGGQRQRVGVARALAAEPAIMLMDEPFGALDPLTRDALGSDYRALHDKLSLTTVMVTHDMAEAVLLADRIVVLRDGEIEQVGTPSELYERPANRFVANFIGSPRMNFLKGTVTGGSSGAVEIAIPTLQPARLVLPVADPSSLKVGDEVEVGVRPDDLLIGEGGQAQLACTIEFSEYIGSAVYLYAPNHPAGRLTIRCTDRGVPPRGEMPVSLDPGKCHVFDAAGQRISAG
jgi:osmoprotectant transport system ATP-binding protein